MKMKTIPQGKVNQAAVEIRNISPEDKGLVVKDFLLS